MKRFIKFFGKYCSKGIDIVSSFLAALLIIAAAYELGNPLLYLVPLLFFSFIGLFLVGFVFDIPRLIYCVLKKNRNNLKKCYYWNCDEFHSCRYNDTIQADPDCPE